MAAALRTRAVEMAQEQLAAARHESQLAVVEAHEQQARAEAERDRLRQELMGNARGTH